MKEDMFERASKKLGLDQAILQNMGFEEGNKKKEAPNSLADMKREEIDRLLKKGAYSVLNDDDEAADAFTAEDIDQILERRTRLLKVGGSNPVEELELSDPQFWQKLMPSVAEKPLLEALEDGQPRTRRQVRRYTMGEEGSSEEPEEDSGDDMVYGGTGSTGRKRFNKGDRQRIQRALLSRGWGRWDIIQKHSGLEGRRTVDEVAQYVRSFVRLLTKYGAEYAASRGLWRMLSFKHLSMMIQNYQTDNISVETNPDVLEVKKDDISVNRTESKANLNAINEKENQEIVRQKSLEEILEDEFKNLEPVLADPEYQSYLQKIAWSNFGTHPTH
eukprot:jgi/Galph1/5033/GphlegSOOS_G60.1